MHYCSQGQDVHSCTSDSLCGPRCYVLAGITWYHFHLFSLEWVGVGREKSGFFLFAPLATSFVISSATVRLDATYAWILPCANRAGRSRTRIRAVASGRHVPVLPDKEGIANQISAPHFVRNKCPGSSSMWRRTSVVAAPSRLLSHSPIYECILASTAPTSVLRQDKQRPSFPRESTN